MEKIGHEELINIYKENEELRKAKNKAESEILRQRTLRQNIKLELDTVKRELEAERMKKYDQYVPEDAVTYQVTVRDLDYYKTLVHDQTDYIKTLEKRIQELEDQVIKLSSNIPVKKATSIIEQNIEQDKLIKSAKMAGRPPKVDNHKIALILELNANGHSIRAIAKQLHVSIGTVHRFIKLDEEKHISSANNEKIIKKDRNELKEDQEKEYDKKNDFDEEERKRLDGIMTKFIEDFYKDEKIITGGKV